MEGEVLDKKFSRGMHIYISEYIQDKEIHLILSTDLEPNVRSSMVSGNTPMFFKIP